MPCEGCTVQFTVFRRKRVCSDCKRFYCNNCLIVRHAISPLCERCAIFSKRPLLRTDLLQLKPKDLIFYLQSKHISTAGCVEKDELIGLVLNHVQQIDERNAGDASGHKHYRSNADPSNPFNNLKQSCQNFFTNISENISDSFPTFDNKAAAKNRQTQSAHSEASPDNGASTHIFDQPRVSTREIPTYASFQRPATAANATAAPTPARPSSEQSNVANRPGSTLSAPVENSYSSPESSPVRSLSSGNTHSQEYATTSARCDAETKWECECSDDDEIIATYSERLASRAAKSEEAIAGTTVIASTSTSGRGADNAGSTTTEKSEKANACDEDQSSQSSFEELGAIGGISDDSKTTTDTNSSNLEQWQILDAQRVENAADVQDVANDCTATLQRVLSPLAPHAAHALHAQDEPRAQPRLKRVSRRRSESYVKKRTWPRGVDDPDDDEDDEDSAASLQQQVTTSARRNSQENTAADQRSQVQCKRCGKSKLNIRRQVEKMQRHLESSQMSEDDIKRELNDFLAYLEMRTKSIDYSDSETAVSSVMGHNRTPDTAAGPPQYLGPMDDDEGIHVYASMPSGSRTDSRFIQLEDYGSLQELECLSVKQLKEVLMLNRVDYKGCCEKQELLDRVERLWKNLKSTPAAEKLQTDELCKICMDAPIECVILECGHMATCTGCGKVLSECPICRQYIVRVVRFFRA